MTRNPTRRFHGERSNAVLSWVSVGCALLVGAWSVLDGRLHEAVYAVTLAAVVLAPALALGSPRAALPWEVSVLAVLPLLVASASPEPFVRQLTLYAGAAVLALAITLELHALTEIRLERLLAAAFVTMLSATIAATWATASWLRDQLVGTAVIASNDQVMWLFVTAVAAGPVAGTIFDRYYRHFPGEELVSASVDGIAEAEFATIADLDGQPSLDTRIPLTGTTQRALVWAMRVGLVAIVLVGLFQLDPGIVSNAAAMLAITFVPTLGRHRYDLPFDAGLVLWLTVALFLHAIGALWLYENTFWWHNVTHTLSATLVGAVGYVAIRTLDEHRTEVHLPPSLVPAFVAVFVIAFGVVWEIGEFGFDLFAAATGLQMPLSQYSLADTMTDLLFNALGGIVVATWGLPYLTELTDAVTDLVAGWPWVDE